MTESIIANPISAVVGAVAIVACRNVVIPWYQGISFVGPRVEGTWTFSHNENGGADDQVVEVKQRGGRLIGVHNVHRWKDGSPANVSIPFTGRIVGQMVLVSGSDPESGTLGAQLLQIRDSGTRLVGYVVTVEPSTGKVCAHAREWFKKLA